MVARGGPEACLGPLEGPDLSLQLRRGEKPPGGRGPVSARCQREAFQGRPKPEGRATAAAARWLHLTGAPRGKPLAA